MCGHMSVDYYAVYVCRFHVRGRAVRPSTAHAVPCSASAYDAQQRVARPRRRLTAGKGRLVSTVSEYPSRTRMPTNQAIEEGRLNRRREHELGIVAHSRHELIKSVLDKLLMNDLPPVQRCAARCSSA